MKKLICIIITLIMTLSLFPVNAAADDTVYKLHLIDGKAEILNPPANPDSLYSWSGDSASGNLTLSSGYKFNLIIDQRVDAITNNGTITEAHFNDTVSICNKGIISGGNFGKLSQLQNVSGAQITGGNFTSASLINNFGTISGGTFNYTSVIENSGTVSGGTFEGKFTNSAQGKIEGSPVFNRTTADHSFGIDVINYGTISSGTFRYNIANHGTVNGGIFECSFNNYENGTISGEAVEVRGNAYSLENKGLVTGGTFNVGMIDNSGTITAGSFPTSQVDNYGTISGGEFGLNSTKTLTAIVKNAGTITGGTFNDIIYNKNGGTIDESYLKENLYTLTLKDCYYYRDATYDKIEDFIFFPKRFSSNNSDRSVTVTAVEKSGMNITGWSIGGGTSSGLNYTFDLPMDNAEISPIYTATHTHSYSEEWKSDENGHWHECSCGAKSGYEKHIPEAFAAKEPTCTEEGYTSGEECSVCGYVISAQETIPAKGHGETEIRDAVPAEIGKEGYTGDTYCKDCGEKLADGEVIPALEKPKDPDPTPTPTPKPTPVIPSIPTAPSTPSKDKWDTASDRIEKLSDGDSVTIDIKDGKTTVPENIIKQIKGKDIDLILDLGNGMSWTINGKSINTPKSIDMGVKKGTKNIPASVLNKVTGEKSTIQLSLKYDGEFGFFAELSVDLGKENNGLYAALYHFNEKTNEMELVDQSEINSGKASFTMSHASEYAIVISDTPVYDNVDSASGANDMSETAESGNAAVCIVIAAAFAAMLIAKKKISG